MPRGKDLKQRQPRNDRHHEHDVLYCSDCGEWFYRFELSKAGLCFHCGQKRMIECNRQLKSKEGEYYERWLAGRALSIVNMKGGING